MADKSTQRFNNVLTFLEGIRDEKNTAANTATRIGRGMIMLLDYFANGVSDQYLSKTSDDTAEGLITFLKGIRLGGDGKFSITEEGAAALASLIVKEIKSDGEVADAILGGSGFHLKLDDKNLSHLFVDYLTVRVKAYLSMLEARKITSVGGNFMFSNASGVICEDGEIAGGKYSDGDNTVEVGGAVEAITTTDADGIAKTTGWRVWMKADDGTTATENWWQVGDQAMCKTFDIDEGVHEDVSNSDYWRLVTEAGSRTVGVVRNNETVERKFNYIVLSDEDNFTGALSDSGGNAVHQWQVTLQADGTYDDSDYPWTGRRAGTDTTPKAGDTLVQCGSQTDPAGRGNAIQIVTCGDKDGGEAVPSINVYSAVNRFSFDGGTNSNYHARVIQISPEGIVATVKKSQITIVNDAGDPVSLFNWRGEWDGAVSYEYGDVVSYGGQAYVWDNGASGSTTGTPPDGEMSGDGGRGWSLAAGRGERGYDAVQVQLLTDRGVTLRPGLTETTIAARVYKGGEDVTAQLEKSSFSWTRTTSDTASDAAWNATHAGVGDTITVTKAEVFRRSMFECVVDTSALCTS